MPIQLIAAKLLNRRKNCGRINFTFFSQKVAFSNEFTQHGGCYDDEEGEVKTFGPFVRPTISYFSDCYFCNHHQRLFSHTSRSLKTVEFFIGDSNIYDYSLKFRNFNLSRLCLEKSFQAADNNFKTYVKNFRFESTFLSVDKAALLRQSAKLLRLQGPIL